ncbi:MAG: glycosyltransferase family 2 protein [bacterium]|nr:glycosyltransferase family 2 protein [bacterium]
MDLRIVIVSWNVRERLRVCLRSIVEHAGGIALDTVVVDNASADGTVDMVRAEFPWVRVIANGENRGFAVGCNQGIGAASESESEYVLLLNPDMRVLAGTLPGIVAFMREPRNARVGIAGCHLVSEKGATIPHVRMFPQLSDQLAILAKLPHVVPRVLDRYLVRDFNYAREAHVDSIRGSFFCIRRAIIEQLGGLDEEFFLWFEEVDYCKRATDAGWQVSYTPSVRCVDFVGQSFAQVPTAAKQRMFTRSMLTYFRKHHAPWKSRVLGGARPLAVGITALHDVWHR